MLSIEQKIAHTVRVLAADAVENSGSGHPGMPLGCAEIGAVIYAQILRHDPSTPTWPDRDRFVLSAGHGSMLLYSLLHLCGYAVTLDDLRRHRRLGSITPGHPEHGLTPGVEVTTGPLGQGFAHAVGLAIAEAMLSARYNQPDFPIVDHCTYALVSDGDLMEGIAYEAASLAGHLRLHKLIAVYDSNGVTFDGPADAVFTESVADRFRACEWSVDEVDGHDVDALRLALASARRETQKPSLVVAKTRIARHSAKEGRVDSHGTPLGAKVVADLRSSLGFPEEPFSIPSDVRDFFEEKTKGWARQRETWNELFETWSDRYPELRSDWDLAHILGFPRELQAALTTFRCRGPVSTRQLSGDVLQLVADHLPYLVGGAADVATSTKSWIQKAEPVSTGRFAGRNIQFGVREHAMGAICNGISLHGGFRAYASTFLTFSDYMRPAIRLAALMGLPIIYIFTHDSVYVGEDGPTHQAIEQAEALRVIPNLRVFRPGPTEVGFAWLESLRRTDGPTALILSRQTLACPANAPAGAAEFRRGGYVIRRESVDCLLVLVLLSSGSELDLAWEVAERLEAQAYGVRVVSVPCREVFVGQPIDYLNDVLGPAAVQRAVIEAGVSGAWYRLLRPGDAMFSVEQFGESGPGPEVAKQIGLSADSVVTALRRLISREGKGDATDPGR